MKQYSEIVKNTMNGEWKVNRTGVKAKTVFCEIFRHNMANGFPLLTTKKMYMKGVAIELEGFIGGITDKEWYKERRCRIWNEWGNPELVEEAMIEWRRRNREATEEEEKEAKNWFQETERDLGPIYGYQWRWFNWPYENKETVDGPLENLSEPYDQFNTVVQKLKEDPDDRRMVVSAWNPLQISKMALPPCHYAFTLVHINGVLNLSWKQRSCDLMLGVPFNIASYALLLELLCKESNLIPGELVGVLEDCHIYEDKMSGAIQQLERDPKPLPTIEIKGDDFNIFDWTHEDYELLNYESHPKIDFGKVAV